MSLIRYIDLTIATLLVVTIVFLSVFAKAAGVSAEIILLNPVVLSGFGYVGYVVISMFLALGHISKNAISTSIGQIFADKFEYVFAFLIVFFGSIYCFITPPMQVSDEAAHFYRAYEISSLNFSASGIVPRNVAVSGVSLVGSLPGRPTERASINKILANYSLPLDQGNEYQLTNGLHTARHYPPFPYIISALGIATGKVFDFPPVILMYFGRVCNLLFFAALTFLTYRILPFGKPLLVCLTLLPMTLSLGSSLSADGFTAMFCFLCVAVFLELSRRERKLTGRQLSLLTLMLCVAILSKNGAYIALSLLIFLLPTTSFGSKKAQVLYFGITSVLAFSLVLLWQQYMTFSSVYGKMASPSGTQRILERPWEYVNFLYEVVTGEMGYMLDTFVGRLGWNDTTLPSWIQFSALGLFVFFSSFANTEGIYPNSRQRVVLLSVTLINILLIYYAFFSLNILGIQGRYFIPLSLCPLLAFTSRKLNFLGKREEAEKWRIYISCGLVIYFSVVHLVTYQVLAERYWSLPF